jgi:hypothetical protein
MDGGFIRLLPAFGGVEDLSAVAHAKADARSLEISRIFLEKCFCGFGLQVLAVFKNHSANLAQNRLP